MGVGMDGLMVAIIQMAREQNSNSWGRRLLIRLFLQRNTTAPYLQTIQTCLEAVLYVSVINGFSLVPALFTPTTATLAIGLILAGLLLARVGGGLSLVKFVYIPILCYAIGGGSASSSCVRVLVALGVLVVVEVTSSISFDFYSDNLASQSLNGCKWLHFAGMLFGVTQGVLWSSFILDGVCCGLWVGVWLYKRASICRDRNFKELQLLIYLWLASSHLMVMLQAWIALPLVLQLALPLGFTQAVLRVYLQRRGLSKLDELYSQENYLKMAFELMIYLHGEAFSPAMDRQLEAFLADPNYSALKDADRRRLVNQKLLDMLSRRNAFEEQLISSQILIFHGHQLLRAKAVLTRLQEQVGCLSWMRRICIYRVGEALREMHARKTAEIHFAHYEEYYRCDAFRSMLLRSATAFLTLWEYSRRPEVVSQRIRVLADRLVILERRLRREFADIQPKCLTLSLLYVSYLLEVARDSIAANLILEGLAFNEDFEISLQLDEKLFIQVSLQGEGGPLLGQVGPNASLLLGFEKKELQGQRMDILLPEFYRKFHSSYLDECFEKQFPRLYLYCKKTIVRNKWGYYEECNIMLRLHFSPEGQLVLRGYLHIKPSNNYLWTHFLFIAENEDILECSQNLSFVAPSASRLHRAGELFEEVHFSQALVQKTSDSLIEYHPLLVFGTDTQKVFYYVRAVKEEEWVGERNGREDMGRLLENMQLWKLEWSLIKSYYLRAQDLLVNLYAKEYILLALLGLVAVGGLLICQGYFLLRASEQASSEQSVMSTTSQILSYYDSSISLGMRIAFVGLKLAYNYTNAISVNNVLNLSLILQTNNEKLKGFTRNNYALPSLIPNVAYSKPNYDMIVELLSNAFMIRQFSDDAFLQSTVLSRAQLSLYPIFAISLSEYEGNFVQSVKEMPPDQGEFVAIACLIILLLLLCAIMLRVEHRLRRDEQQALTLLVSVRHQEELITTAKQFVSKVTREDVTNLRYEQDNHHHNAVYNSTFAQDNTVRGEQGVSRSEMSLREISGRDLLGDSFNRSGVLQSGITSRIDAAPQAFSSQSPEIALTPRKRWLYGVFLGLVGAIGGLSLANEVQYNIRGQINLTTSVTNIFSVFSTGTIFSRSMVLFLNLVAQRNLGPIDSSQFDSFMGNYSQTQVVVTFPESSFSQFQPFQDLLSQVTYQYMCSYLPCDPNFANEVNIIYTTTIQKLIASALTYKTQLNQMNASTLAIAVRNGSMTHFIDLVYYAEMSIRGELLSLISLYLDCFNSYSNTLMMKKRVLMGAAMGITLVSLGLLVGLIVFVARHQGLLRDIANLVKTDSYINEDNQIADKEAFRPAATQQSK